jgi:recombination protein RecR
MNALPESLVQLIDEMARLPGIGPKSAQRIAYYILQTSNERVFSLSDALIAAKNNIKFCKECFNFCEGDVCEVCTDDRRDEETLCVVEEPKDLTAIERTREYHGKYHVLQGSLSPMDGIGPDQLKIRELFFRLSSSKVTEVILATNPTVEGEATSMYLARAIAELSSSIKLTRLASGLPVGGDLEFADEVTLARALSGRVNIS